MNLKRMIKSKKILWHNHFWPSVFAGLLVALISFLFEGTLSNILLFASVGASAAILTNSKSHHLTKLYTVVYGYLIAVCVSSGIYLLSRVFLISLQVNLFLIIFLVTLSLYLFNTFHPPAITASISFILAEKSLFDLSWLFLLIICLLIIWRFLVYLFVQKLPLREFETEFKKTIIKKLHLND